MTWRFRERDLEITISEGESARKFDDQPAHGVSYMKAVDFVVELPDRYIFIEVKDPQQSGSELTRVSFAFGVLVVLG